MLFFSLDASRRGPALIVVGMIVVTAAQFWTAVPVVATVVLIGWGAILTLHVHPRSRRQDALSIVNLSVYATLVCLAIVAQSHWELQQSANRARLLMLIDHSTAIMLLFALAARVFRRVCEPLAQDG